MSKLSYNALRNRADAVRWSIWRRAKAACIAAGTGDAGVNHNALVSAEYGKPWREVDYSKARLARRLFASQFDAKHVLDRLVARKGFDAFDWG